MPPKKRPQNEFLTTTLAKPTKRARSSTTVTQTEQTVPKSEPGKYRVIHDLSFPRHNSVNLRIPTENSQVQYDSIDTITQLVNQFGQGALMAKTDIKDAFWIIPSHPDNHRLLCFSWDCFYYFDKCLPMGASSSCKIF